MSTALVLIGPIALVKPSIDRLSHLRADDEALLRERAHPEARVAPIWRRKCLLTLDEPARALWLPLGELSPEEPLIFLGRDEEDRPCFSVDISGLDDPSAFTGGGRFVDLRRAGFSMPLEALEPLFYVQGLMLWHEATRACEQCGSTDIHILEGGFKRQCRTCGLSIFPRTDPAVMILVTRGDRVLLARQPRFPPSMFSVLAGFVEPGESLEQCVIRETREEVGLEVSAPIYLGSAPWPFPRSLMIGFRVEASTEDFILDETELEDGRWFSREELRKPAGFFYPPRMSLANRLIREFIEEG